ncbi:unnamed protein product [Lactuca virosa]|uniref:Uncharacterized protein n=1 Tax=Lactuca virosa TaxID=75947 RepID=A0AAU9LKJ6_9ASTR|nr:unnamed protein product [Lactuca virosa]
MSSSLLENAPHDLLYPKLASHHSPVFTKSTRGLCPLIHLQPSPPLLVLLPLHQVIKHPQLKRRRSRSQPPPTFVVEPSTQSNSFVGTEEYIAPV